MSDTLPYLEGHQAPQVAVNTPLDYDPSPDEKKIVKKVEKMFQRAKAHRAMYDAKWIDWYKMFRGQQWADQRPSYRASAVFNLIFQTIQSQIPILTDARPKFDYMPEEPSDREFAEIMSDISEADWESKNYGFKFTEVMTDAHIYGTGCSSLTYEPDCETGEEEINYSSKDVFYLFPDPDAESLEEKCDSVIYAEPVCVEKVKRDYPEHAEYIKSDIQDTLDSAKNDVSSFRRRSPANDRMVMEGSSSRLSDDQKKVTLITAYYKDSSYDEEETEEIDEDGVPTPVYVRKLRYPKMRKSVIANGMVLEDGPNDYADGRFPYQIMVNYLLPREFWGISEIEQLEGPQKTFNQILSCVLDTLHLMGNPIWVVDHTANIDAYKLTNAPGLIVEKSPGSEVRREAGVALQPYVLQVADLVKGLLEQIAGSQDITRGINPGGVTAASAIADLQNAAQTRLRQKSRLADAYLQRLGQQYASRVMQFYTAPKVFRITGKDGIERFFQAFFKQSAEGRPVVSVRHFNEDTGGLSDQFNEYELRGKLDLRVTTGTSLPFSKEQKRRDLESLYDRGIIDDEEFLKSIDYPNYQAVLERKRQKEAEMAAMQAQQQQPVK